MGSSARMKLRWSSGRAGGRGGHGSARNLKITTRPTWSWPSSTSTSKAIRGGQAVETATRIGFGWILTNSKVVFRSSLAE